MYFVDGSQACTEYIFFNNLHQAKQINTIKKLSKCILLILLLYTLTGCKGVDNSTTASNHNSKEAVGTSVSVLDDQIWAIFEDTKGQYWFGSNGSGVYCLRGTKLHRYTANDGLVNNQIRGIQEDSLGNIYLETPTGVSQFDGQQFRTLEVLQSSYNAWELNATDLWFNGIGDYLYRYDGQWLHALELPPQDALGTAFDNRPYNPYSVYGINKDKAGNIWFGTLDAGAFRYDGQSFLWIGEQELLTLPDGRVPGVRCMLHDKDGYMWLSNFHHKYQLDTQSAPFYTKMQAVDLAKQVVKDKLLYFNDGISDKDGHLWMTSYQGGLWKYDGLQLHNWEIQPNGNTILLVCIYMDSQGVIWLGSNNDGVYQFNGNSFKKFEP